MYVPREVLDGQTRIVIQGNSIVYIENYIGIRTYTDQEVCITAKNYRICIRGKQLFIEYYGNTDMKLSGNIQKIEFV